MNKENTMNEAQKIAQALAAIPADFRDKAVAATMRSQFWEIIDCPVTLDLALAFAGQMVPIKSVVCVNVPERWRSKRKILRRASIYWRSTNR
ncbi:hypothetical protein OFY05_23160 (plasmid) [Pseudocitrobacter faecalis]|nr:hypothetical protein OFY05_23160 [Pseudocitrobacter faecalis]